MKLPRINLTHFAKAFQGSGDSAHVPLQNPGPAVTVLVIITNINLENAQSWITLWRLSLSETVLKYGAKVLVIDMIFFYKKYKCPGEDFSQF